MTIPNVAPRPEVVKKFEREILAEALQQARLGTRRPACFVVVGAQETASGTSHGTRGRTLLAVVRTESPQRYYPQDPPISTGWRGGWKATVYFGEEGGPGGTFELLLVETGDAAPFDEYYRAARASGSWEGLEALPEGAAVLDTVRVTRR